MFNEENVTVMLEESLIKQNIFIVNRGICSLDDPQTERNQHSDVLHFNSDSHKWSL